MESFNYAKWRSDYRRHHERYVARVENREPKLICQECRGGGGYIDVILDDGSGPFEECPWCEGTGLLDNYGRGVWLFYKRQEAIEAKSTEG